MDPDGRNKRDVSGQGGGFAYGYSASPDGKRISYHENYQIYLSNPDGSEKRKVETRNPFNFAPQWSPDGEWLLFVSGEHYNCHPHVVKKDGTGLKKIADRVRVMRFATAVSRAWGVRFCCRQRAATVLRPENWAHGGVGIT